MISTLDQKEHQCDSYDESVYQIKENDRKTCSKIAQRKSEENDQNLKLLSKIGTRQNYPQMR
jgi:hypothetical protein